MKPRIYISTILLGASLLFTAEVKADNCNNNNSKSSSPSTNLPIDSGIAFLAIAGTAIGMFAVKRAKKSAVEVSVKA